MKKLILFLCIFSSVVLADTPIKNIKITGADSEISSGALAVKTGVTVTYESGSTLDITDGTLSAGAVTFTDIATGNASTGAHGLQKKLSGNAYEFANGAGDYAIPSQIPLNTQNAAYTFVLTDAGKTIFHDEVTARVYTIPANASVAYPIGTAITIINNTSGGTITLSIATDTLRRGDGTAGTGSRTITADSAVTIIKTKSTEWFITGKFS